MTHRLRALLCLSGALHYRLHDVTKEAGGSDRSVEEGLTVSVLEIRRKPQMTVEDDHKAHRSADSLRGTFRSHQRKVSRRPQIPRGVRLQAAAIQRLQDLSLAEAASPAEE